MKRAVLLLLVIVACNTSVGEGSFVLDDGSIDGPDRIDSSETSEFYATNVGEFNHTLVVADSSGRVVAATELIPPGTDVRLEVDLPAGVYSVTCRIVTKDEEGNLLDHYELGMHRTVTVLP